MATNLTKKQRFLRHVDVRGIDECWPWKGHLSPRGYGQFRIGDRKIEAHRAAYSLFVGDPGAKDVHHDCENPRCVNWINHLVAVTHREHIADLTPSSAPYKHKRKTHCVAGHPYDADNTRIIGGSRFCKECDRRRHRKVAA